MSDLLVVLPLLACPIGMGVMMLVMARGRRSDESSRADEVARLHAEVQRLRGEVAGLPDSPRSEVG